MDLSKTIYTRKSIRKYKEIAVSQKEIDQILSFAESVKPLYPDIKVKFEIVPKEKIKCLFSWRPLQYIVIYSEIKNGHLENAGFILQQVDLYLQSVGLGSCWLGLAKPETLKIDNDGIALTQIITLCFGYPDEPYRTSLSEFNRSPMEKISDTIDQRLEPARFAPSAMNSQPWRFKHEGDTVRIYQNCTRILRHLFLKQLNRIDTGIALAHLFVSNEKTFKFFFETAPDIKGHDYIGSFTL